MNRRHFHVPTILLGVLTSLTVSGFLVSESVGLLAQESFEFRGRVLDHASKKPIYARIYLSNSQGKNFLVESTSKMGKAIPYQVIRGASQEVHTTVSNHVFKADLLPGSYKLTVEHGKEYLSQSIEFEVTDHDVQKTVALKRWSNLSDQKWYSGDVHIHRRVDEMPTVMLAEDLNVVLPLTYWVTDTESTPVQHNKAKEPVENPKLIQVTENHVIWPLNTEYEIFTVKGKRHTLGAFFILGHQKPLALKTPPVKPIVEQARAENAIIDLDKHNWPWSMMLIPQMKVDLFELSNNHIWRTRFLFKNWYKEYVAEYMDLDLDPEGNFNAASWLKFGFANYYALLNCGVRISPSAGTATGVHPVPAGFGRVYVHLPEGFSYEAWMKGLKAGNSFVSTGPLLDARIDGKFPGHEFQFSDSQKFRVAMTAKLPSKGSTDLELIVNGEIIEPGTIRIGKDHNGVRVLTAESEIELKRSSWVCVRCLQKQPNGNVVFAHSAPFYFRNGRQPITPRIHEVNYLTKRVADEIERNRNVLTKEQLGEFEKALQFYQSKLKIAK